MDDRESHALDEKSDGPAKKTEPSAGKLMDFTAPLFQQHTDLLAVGQACFGAPFPGLSRIVPDHGKRCLGIGCRDPVGGNLYCENMAGITVHRYGLHTFQTKDQVVWGSVNRYVK